MIHAMNEIDLHVHTTASGHAFNTLNEYATEAGKRKMKAIAITDHGPNLKNGPEAAYFSVLCWLVPEQIGPVRIFKGIEANILDTDGRLDVPLHTKSKFDLVLAYLHPFTVYRDGGERENTRAIVSALENNPCIDILVHPVTTWFPINIKEIVQAACSQGVAIELNENALKVQRVGKEKIAAMIETTLDSGGRFVSSSDSHTMWTLGNDTKTREVIKEFGIPDKAIINRSFSDITEFIQQRKIRKLN